MITTELSGQWQHLYLYEMLGLVRLARMLHLRWKLAFRRVREGFWDHHLWTQRFKVGVGREKLGCDGLSLETSGDLMHGLMTGSSFRTVPRWSKSTGPSYTHSKQSFNEGLHRKQVWAWTKPLSSVEAVTEGANSWRLFSGTIQKVGVLYPSFLKGDMSTGHSSISGLWNLLEEVFAQSSCWMPRKWPDTLSWGLALFRADLAVTV